MILKKDLGQIRGEKFGIRDWIKEKFWSLQLSNQGMLVVKQESKWGLGGRLGNAGRGFNLSSSNHNGAATVVDGTVVKSGEQDGVWIHNPRKEGDKIKATPSKMIAAERQSDWEHTIVCYFLDMSCLNFHANNIAHNQDKDGLMEVLSNDNGLSFIIVIDMDAVNALIDRASLAFCW